MFQTVRSALPLLIVAAIALIGAIVLAALGKDVPAELWATVLAGITGGAGVTVPSHGATQVQDQATP